MLTSKQQQQQQNQKWLVVLGRGLIHLTARPSGSNGHAKLQTQAVDTPPHRNPGSRRPQSGSRAISLNRFCPRLMAQHAPMDGYGQSRALDGDPRAEAAPRHEGQSRPRAAWTARWPLRLGPPGPINGCPQPQSRAGRISFQICICCELRVLVCEERKRTTARRGGCRAAEATAGAAPAASAAAAAEGKPAPSLPSRSSLLESDLTMNLRAYGLADLPFVALFPSDLC